MTAYVVCPIGSYNPSKPSARQPKLSLYMGNYEVKADAGNWCVCIVWDSTAIPAAAQNDSEVFVFATEAELDNTLSGAERNRVNQQLALTTWGVTSVQGDTPRLVLDKIRVAIGDSPESWGLGL